MHQIILTGPAFPGNPKRITIREKNTELGSDVRSARSPTLTNIAKLLDELQRPYPWEDTASLPERIKFWGLKTELPFKVTNTESADRVTTTFTFDNEEWWKQLLASATFVRYPQWLLEDCQHPDRNPLIGDRDILGWKALQASKNYLLDKHPGGELDIRSDNGFGWDLAQEISFRVKDNLESTLLFRLIKQ